MQREAVKGGEAVAQAGAGGTVRSPEQLRQGFREALSRCVDNADEAGRLQALMPQLGPLLGANGAAVLLHEALGKRGIAGAEDRAGRCCRSAAVEALLALGHPHALTVSPEDLAWFRAEGRRLPWGVQLLLGGALAAAVNEVWVFGQRAVELLSWLWAQDWGGLDLFDMLERSGSDGEWTIAAALHGVALSAVLAWVMRSAARTRWGRAWQVAGLVLGVVGGVVAAFGRSMGPAWLCAGITLWATLQALQSGLEQRPE